ncbi:roundabout homolog 2-like isoform X2 [Mercenaria mercenaria]|uniref:roundabout homolog 2-like isoform X2 n=1 Tax=Mercenaria mercenaria TaxID=6596 RepID=UPI00234E95E1|nr:roundabout homolog 2-like isoform X2 [Mercenaria mercenaria]
MGQRIYKLEVLAFILLVTLYIYKVDANPEPASPVQGRAPTTRNEYPKIGEGPKDVFFAKNSPGSLDCLASGVPTPTITWYQNGKEVQFDKDHVRMLLPDGQLFFLRFIYTKNQTHVGTYYCKAANSLGEVVSREATVKVAVIKDDFRQEPVDTTRSIHSTVTLHCKPPRGEPDPKISWQHNDRPVSLGDRITQHKDGDLTITTLTAQDSGEYVCLATNKAGVRQSSPALLKVLEVPEITGFPEDVMREEGSTVEFHCEVLGEADIQWKKEGGTSNKQKWRQLPDNTLRIENVEADDEGTYVCTAENAAGVVEAAAHLKIEYTPKFLVRPHDQVVAVGRTISLHCSAAGYPQPTIYWETKAKKDLMFVKYQSDRFSVSDDGTLRIERIQKSDQGSYSCIAYSSKGKAQASADISVRDNDLRPPPIIRFGPINQTLEEDAVALLRCQATGDPKPIIRWYKNGRSLDKKDARYLLLDSGTLQISSLKISDSGNYMCKAGSETGETTMTAKLIVESEGRSFIKSPPDLTEFPGAPEKPVVSDVTDTSVRLSWKLFRDTGASPVDSYQVEYFGYGLSESWKIAGARYTSTDITVDGLVPNTTYVFLVRAINSHGKGGPSPLSEIIRTLEKGHNVVPTITLPVAEIEERLRDIQVSLLRGEAVNSSAIRISWMVNTENKVVTGFVVQYRHILNMGDRHDHRYGQTVIKRVPYRPLSHTITGLESYEYYEICVMAASGTLTSSCSKPMKIQSGESVPTRPPKDTVIERVSDSEVLVKWSAPDIEHRKGEIIGYQVKCSSEDGVHNCSKHTNGSTHEVKIDGLVPGVNYNIEIAAQTQKGVGKFSTALSVGPDENQITKKAWFIGMIGALGGILWLGLCIFTVWLCKSRKRRKKLKEQWYTGGPRTSDKTSERNGSVARKGYGVKDGNFQDNNEAGLPPEYNTLLQQSQHESSDNQSDTMYNMANHPEMKTFYQQSGPVTPYATTALLQAQAQAQNSRKQSGDQLFRPINPGCKQYSGGSGDSATDRSITTDVSIESREPNRSSAGDSGHLSDENGMLIKQLRKPGYRPGMPQNQPVVNWNDVLPPPPNHPPSDGEYLQDDQLYSEIPEDRARSPLSPVSMAQMSACSCPVTHPHQMQNFSPGAYSDNCNRCMSLRNFDNRPYSPQQLAQMQRQHVLPPNISRTLGAPQRGGSQRGGTPVYLHGYSQPWDSQPLPRGPYEYDYAQVPREDGYNYTQPIQDGLIDRNIDYNDSSVPYQGPPRDFSNIPGGPPGNYCEGPCRGQMNNLNALNTSYHRNRGETSQIPCLDGYKIESPPSSASEYRVCNSGGSSAGSAKSRGGMKGRSSSEGNDLKDKQYVVGPETQCRPLMYHSRSESSQPGHCMIDEGYSRNADSPISEDPDYAEDSENGVDRTNERDSMVANWESQEDCSELHSSSSNVSEEGDNQFLNEEDFASAVARAAELSGLTVVGTTVSDPNPKQGKKAKRHHRQARPISPGYSTDSNYGTADIPHKPYPKSQRRKQLVEHGKLRKKGDNSSSKEDSSNTVETTNEIPSPDTKNGSEKHGYINPLPASPAKSGKSEIPSLYRSHRSPGGGTGQEVQQNSGNSGNKLGMFNFGDDIPVV